MNRIRATLAAIGLFSCISATAAAQDAAGSISSVAYAALPPGTPVEIQYLGDSEINQSLRNLLARELELRGYPVVARGSVVLRFDSDIEATDTSGRRLLYSGSVAGNERSEFGLRVRPFGGGEPPLRDATRYKLTISVGPQGGAQYWIGSAQANAASHDRASVARAMAYALMETFNATTTERALQLD